MGKDERPHEIVPPEGYLEPPAPSYADTQGLRRAIADHEYRIAKLETALGVMFARQLAQGAAPALPEGQHPFPGLPHGFPGVPLGPAEPPVIAAWFGPVLHAPASQLIKVCVWSSVTVILSERGFFGGVTPVAGATVTFSITSGTGVSISSNPTGPGVRPGTSVGVTTNARGEATIYIHGAAAGKATLNADGPGSTVSKDTAIDIAP